MENTAKGRAQAPPVIPQKRMAALGKGRLKALESALEKRLEALIQGLEDVDVTGKGIDVIKEIKELHALLEGMHAAEQGGGKAAEAPRLVVVWECPASAPANAPAADPPEEDRRG